jgi:hypothetical protein
VKERQGWKGEGTEHNLPLPLLWRSGRGRKGEGSEHNPPPSSPAAWERKGARGEGEGEVGDQGDGRDQEALVPNLGEKLPHPEEYEVPLLQERVDGLPTGEDRLRGRLRPRLLHCL